MRTLIGLTLTLSLLLALSACATYPPWSHMTYEQQQYHLSRSLELLMPRYVPPPTPTMITCVPDHVSGLVMCF